MYTEDPVNAGSFQQQRIMYRKGDHRCEVTLILGKSEQVIRRNYGEQLARHQHLIVFDDKALKLEAKARFSRGEVEELADFLVAYRQLVKEQNRAP